MDDPIMVPCEGSRQPGNDMGAQLACAMCGQMFGRLEYSGEIPEHSRRDILAMIERGDYD